MKKKILAVVILVISLVITFNPVISSNYEVKDIAYAESSNYNESVSCVESEKTIKGSSETYAFSSAEKINKVVSTGNIKLLNYQIRGNNISCTLSNFKDSESLRIDFYSGSSLVDYYYLHFAKDTKGFFHSSSLSMDTAKRNAGQITNYTFSDEETMETVDADTGILLMSYGVTGRVSGTFNWTDDEGNIHPLIGAKVAITIDGSSWSDEAYTDQSGYYSFDYNDVGHAGTGKPSIHIYADNGESVKVTNGGTYEKIIEMSGNSGNFNCSYTFSPLDSTAGGDGDIGRAIIIFQAAKSFADYAKAMNGGEVVKSCQFKYPGDPSKGCYYDPNINSVTIADRSGRTATSPNSYSSWDVIGHEYGHHIQNCYEISKNPGGSHFIPSNNIDDQKNSGYSLELAKDRGLRLAWAEGWPTYWSTVAQSTFSEDIKSIKTVGDTFYTSYNGLNYDLDSYSASSRGDADEQAIQRVLYKLTSNATDAFDKFAIDVETLFNITITNKPHRFYEFIEDLYNAGYNRYNLGLLLGQYNIAVSTLVATDEFLDKCPEFQWSTYMGSNNLRYNSFDLVFLNTRGQEVLRKNNIEASGDTCEYRLTRNEWSNIISVYGRTYYAYIVARQTYSFTSGPYYSQLFKFSEPDDFDTKVQIKPSEWGFEPQYFFESNCAGHTTTTITDHGLTITTNRLRCGYIEDSYVVLSPKRQNAGKAYLELYFDKPVYSYMFGITLWSNNEGLSSSDCTAVVEVLHADGNWYEDWDLLNDLPNGFSVKTQQIDRYASTCIEGIYGLRFVMTAPATGDRNKGRLCLDDIVLNTDPDDLWFISTFYE